jgi:hypothetical protein
VRFSRIVIAIAAAVVLLLVALAVWRRGPSIDEVSALIVAHPTFAEPRFAAIPRQVYVNPGFIGGELAEDQPYTRSEIAFVSPIIGALSARRLVDVTDYVGPADTLHPPRYNEAITDSHRMDPRSSRAFSHSLYVRPTTTLRAMAGFAESEEGEAVRENAGAIDITTTPAWRLPVATRELIRVVGVEARSTTPSAGGLRATFCWRWKATKDGALFDVGSDAFDDLPEDLWKDTSPTQNVRSLDAFFDANMQVGEAIIGREHGRWTVSGISWLEPSASELDCSPPHTIAAPTPPSGVGDPAAEDSARREFEWSNVRGALSFLQVQQRSYHWRKGTYATDVSELGAMVFPSTVSMEILFADHSGWSAIGRHSMFPGKACVTWIGRVNQVPVTAEGTRVTSIDGVACDTVSFQQH